MDQNPVKKEINDDDISIKDLIIKVKSLIKYLKSKWIVILIFGVLGSLLGLTYSLIKKPIYTAVCTFVLEEGNKGGGLSQFSGLASMAGIDVGGGGGGIFQGDNIIELYKSRSMIEKTLLSEVDFNGKKQKLIDRYIDFNKLRSKLKDKSGKDISFSSNADKFTRAEDSIITNIAILFNKSVLDVSKPDKKLNIIQVSASSNDELFAKEFTNKLVDNVNNFYILTKTKKSLQNVAILQKQRDSLRTILNGSIGGVASALDAVPNANPTRASLHVASQKIQIDVQATSAIYSEAARNFEIAKISLRQETPLIEVIDKPVFPLQIERLSKSKGITFGGVIGVIISLITLVGYKSYRKIIEADS